MSWGRTSSGRCGSGVVSQAYSRRCGLGVFGAAWVRRLFPGVVATSCLVVGLRGLFGVSWPFSGILWASVSAGWSFVVSYYRSWVSGQLSRGVLPSGWGWGWGGLWAGSKGESSTCVLASPSEVYTTDKLQWHFTYGFDFSILDMIVIITMIAIWGHFYSREGVKQVHISLAVHKNSLILKFDIFSEFQNVINDNNSHPERHFDALRT